MLWGILYFIYGLCKQLFFVDSAKTKLWVATQLISKYDPMSDIFGFRITKEKYHKGSTMFLFSFESRYSVNTDMHNYVRTIGNAKLSVNQTVSLHLLRIRLNDEININKKDLHHFKIFIYYIDCNYFCQKDAIAKILSLFRFYIYQRSVLNLCNT